MTWTELDYRWAGVLWKGREILCDAPSQNYCSTHKNGLSSLTGCITWTCGESERMPECVLWWSSVHQTMVIIMMIKMIFNSSKYCQNRSSDAAATSNLRRMIVKSEMLDHRKKWKVCLFVIFSIYDNTWNLKPASKEEFQSSAFLETACQKIFEIFMLDSSKKVVRWKISLQTSDLQNRQCKVQKWFVTYESWAKIFKTLIHSV